jgi:DNA-directed RNA polymerase subunit RPC12/RpoP
MNLPKKKFIIKKRVPGEKTSLAAKPAPPAPEPEADEIAETAPPAPASAPPPPAAAAEEPAIVEDVKFFCIRCGQKLAIRGNLVGHQVNCPLCKNNITVPEPL